MKDIYSPLEIDEEWDNFAPDAATATAEAPAPTAPGTKITVQSPDTKNKATEGVGDPPDSMPGVPGDPPNTFQPIEIRNPETNVNSTGTEPGTSMVGLDKQEDGSYEPVVQDNILPDEEPTPPRVAAGGSPPPDGPDGNLNALPAEPNTKQPIDTTGGIVDPGNNMESAMGTGAAKETDDEARRAAEENMRRWMANNNGSAGDNDTLKIEDTGANAGNSANNRQPGEDNLQGDGKDPAEMAIEKNENDDAVNPIKVTVADTSTAAGEKVGEEEDTNPEDGKDKKVGWENDENSPETSASEKQEGSGDVAEVGEITARLNERLKQAKQDLEAAKQREQEAQAEVSDLLDEVEELANKIKYLEAYPEKKAA